MNWILAHLIGDYILQNDWMALGKKRSNSICLVHVLTYLIPFLFTGLVWWGIVLIGIEHFIQDRTNIILWFMRMKGSAKFAEPPIAPWSIILTDNIIHILFIAFIFSVSRYTIF
jgi:hypothetical protein